MGKSQASPLAIVIAIVVLLVVLFVIFKLTLGKGGPATDQTKMPPGVMGNMMNQGGGAGMPGAPAPAPTGGN